MTGGELVCGKEEHTHDDSCHTGGGETLTCGKEEGEGATDGHQHSDSCYGEDGELTCGKDEGEGAEEGHHHDDSCYGSSDGELTCSKEEHKHNESCYNGGEKKLICGLEEGAGAAEIQAAPAAETPAADAAPAAEAPAVEGEHIHTDACYELQKVLICGKEEGELEEIPMEEEFKAGKLTCKGEDYEIVVSYGAEAKIPEDAKLEVEEIPEDSDTYREYYDKMLDAVTESEEEEQEITFARLFDITIFSKDGKKVEPEKPVEVQIIYDDVVAEEQDNGFAVHFPDDGDAEVIKAEVTDGKEFKHKQSSFSLTISAARAKQTNRLVMRGNGFEITAEFKESFKLGTRELAAENITSNNEKNSNGKYQQHSRKAIKDKLDQQKDPEVSGARVFEVSVKEDGKQIGADNVKITVRYTDKAEKANSAGSKVMVLNDGGDSGRVLSSEAVQEDEEVAVFSGTQNFSAAAPNVMTTMLAAVTLDVGETKPIQYSILKDSEWLKYPENNTTWQIVEEEYDGNEPENKPTKGLVAGKSDDHVFIQKNVIPTGTENEFLVYLSIDTKAAIEESIRKDVFYSVTQGSEAATQVGTLVHPSRVIDVSIDKTPKYSKHAPVIITYKGTTIIKDEYISWSQGNNVEICMRRDKDQEIVVGNKDLGKDEKLYHCGRVTNGDTTFVLELTDDMYNVMKSVVVDYVSLNSVTDIMGDNIEDVVVLGGDYVTKPEPETKTDENGVTATSITWIPEAKDNPVKTEIKDADGKVVSIIGHNVAELVYKVRLKVEEEGFNSCASNMEGKIGDQIYPVNKSAVLDYSFGKTDNKTSGTATFPVPKVRGLLYDIRAKKVDESGDAIDSEAVQNAEFKLKKSGDADDTFVTHEVTGDDGNTTVTDIWKPNADGTLDFEDLPWGTYTIVETKSPDRYAAMPEGGKEIGTVTVCWTTDQESLITDPDKMANKLYVGTPQVPEESEALEKEGNRILIKNIKLPPIMLEKVWDDEQNKKGLRPSDIQFKVEYTGKVATDQTEWLPVTEIKNVEGEIIGDANGIVHLSGEINAGSWSIVIENLPDAETYQVTEILRDAPSNDINYQIKPVSENEVNVRDVQYSGKTIKCYTIANELKSREVELYKIDAASMDADEFEYLNEAEFKLYDKISESFEADKTAREKYTWTSGGEDIPNGQFFTGELKVGDYWLEETRAPENYKADGPYILHIGVDEITLNKQDGTLVYTGVPVPENDSTAVRVPNTLDLLSGIKLTKISGENEEEKLDGAEFVLGKVENEEEKYAVVNDATENTVSSWVNEQSEATKFTSDADGVADLPKLNAGTYTLTEVKAPDGYNLLAYKISFTVGVNSTTKQAEVKLLADPNINTSAKVNDDDPLNIIISNSTGMVLPEAGGPGTAAYTFGGLAMIIAVSLMYGLNMRRKREKGGLK